MGGGAVQHARLSLKVVDELDFRNAKLPGKSATIDGPSVLDVRECHCVALDAASTCEAASGGPLAASQPVSLSQKFLAAFSKLRALGIAIVLGDQHFPSRRLTTLGLRAWSHMEEHKPSVCSTAVARHDECALLLGGCPPTDGLRGVVHGCKRARTTRDHRTSHDLKSGTKRAA